jgi:hypothetical protein
VTGSGQNQKGGTWIYELRGTRSDKGDTKITGRMTQTNGAIGYRECSIVFFKPRHL